MIVTSVHLDTRKLDRLDAELEQRAETILSMSAKEIQGAAVENTTRVKTSAMKNGWREEPYGRLQRIIYNTQEYALYWELGHNNFSAEPMLKPAVEKYRQKLTEAWGRLFIL